MRLPISCRLTVALLLSCSVYIVSAQKKKTVNNSSATSAVKYSDSLFNGLKWRNIGPFRGGRSLAVCGVDGDPMTYYGGAAGGGLWKTTDGGRTWDCISDSGFTSSSVGAVAVAKSNPNVVYAGMGEVEMRGNISFGDGVYKSIDAGKTWKHIGLEDSYAIGTIVIHPQNPDIVYVAAQGKIWGPTPNKEGDCFEVKMAESHGKRFCMWMIPPVA